MYRISKYGVSPWGLYLTQLLSLLCGAYKDFLSCHKTIVSLIAYYLQIVFNQFLYRHLQNLALNFLVYWYLIHWLLAQIILAWSINNFMPNIPGIHKNNYLLYDRASYNFDCDDFDFWCGSLILALEISRKIKIGLS